MRNPIAFLFIGLFFGTGIGFIWAGSLGVTFDGHDHAEHSEGAVGHATMDHGGMDHSPVQARTGRHAPSLAITLHKDAVSGVNLEIETTNFLFTPESVNQENVPSTGHAHVYVNGKKFARMYGKWLHIPDLPSGKHVIKVELNANSHGVLMVGDYPVAIEHSVTIP